MAFNQKTDKEKHPNYFTYVKNQETGHINGNKKTNIKRIEAATLNHCTLNQYSYNEKNSKKNKWAHYIIAITGGICFLCFLYLGLSGKMEVEWFSYLSSLAFSLFIAFLPSML